MIFDCISHLPDSGRQTTIADRPLGINRRVRPPRVLISDIDEGHQKNKEAVVHSTVRAPVDRHSCSQSGCGVRADVSDASPIEQSGPAGA